MPIPDYELSCLLPPIISDENGRTAGRSPYRCTIAEFFDRFGGSAERKAIFNGFLGFRSACLENGINGFQWLAGSFLEDIETLESRSPRDLDAVTFISKPDEPAALKALKAGGARELFDHRIVQERYMVDHTFIPLRSPPSGIVATTHYWYGLYSHRMDRTWKGILRVELADPTEDEQVAALLAGHP